MPIIFGEILALLSLTAGSVTCDSVSRDFKFPRILHSRQKFTREKYERWRTSYVQKNFEQSRRKWALRRARRSLYWNFHQVCFRLSATTLQIHKIAFSLKQLLHTIAVKVCISRSSSTSGRSLFGGNNVQSCFQFDALYIYMYITETPQGFPASVRWPKTNVEAVVL